MASVTINQAGTYQLTVTDAQGCSGTDSLQAVVLPAPQFGYTSDTSYCPGRPLMLRAEALSEDELQWLWPDGSNGPRFQPDTTAGTFPLIVSNAACSDTVLIEVKKGDCRSDVFIPSAFSPNDDGRNDIFKVYGPEIEPIRLRIYDRWGGLLYEGGRRQCAMGRQTCRKPRKRWPLRLCVGVPGPAEFGGISDGG